MGYYSNFEGEFEIKPSLGVMHVAILNKFADERHDDGRDPWCEWRPSEDGAQLEGPGHAKFYGSEEWLVELIRRFFVPWQRTLNGTCNITGEDPGDIWRIVVTGNEVRSDIAEITWPEED